jgi:hypothetical protein
MGVCYNQVRKGACVTLWQLAHKAPKIRSGCPKINKSTKDTHSHGICFLVCCS